MRPYLALIGITLKLAMREKAVLFFNFVLPMAFLFGFGQLMRADSGGVSHVVTMVLVFGVLGSGLYGAGLRAVSEREPNILRRYKVAPITPAPLLVASMVDRRHSLPSDAHPHPGAGPLALRPDDPAAG